MIIPVEFVPVWSTGPGRGAKQLMPFPDHRTMAEIMAEETAEQKANQWGVTTDAVRLLIHKEYQTTSQTSGRIYPPKSAPGFFGKAEDKQPAQS